MIRNHDRKFESCKPTLEQRIARLERAIAGNKALRRINESADEWGDAILRIVQNDLEPDYEVLSGSPDGNEYEIDIQDNMGDEMYYDDWESNYETYTVTEDGRGYTVSVVGNFANKTLGTFQTVDQAANAIINFRRHGD